VCIGWSFQLTLGSPNTHLNRELLRNLKPANYGNHGCESFASYLPRAQTLVPHFPDSVAEQWLHRHYNDVVSQYGWLGFEDLRFTLDGWTVERILREVRSFEGQDYDSIKHWVRWFRDPKYATDDWLVQSMTSAGTWPQPIITVRNPTDLALPNGLPLGKPFHLVEGHHRLGFLMAMADDCPDKLLARHDLWIIETRAESISSEWPNL